jgi:thioesterase domain-containing protein
MPARLADDAAILSYLGGPGLPAEELRRLAPEDPLRLVVERARAAGGGFEELDLETARGLLFTFRQHMKAMRAYVPRPYPGRLSFFRASSRRPGDPRHPERPWIELAQGGLEIHHVPGDHISMHHPPNLDVLAERLRGCLLTAVRPR